MTCVAPLYNWHQPVHDTDTSELGALLEAYKKAGFPGTFYWSPPMGLQLTDLAGYGDETSRRWQQKYIQVMRLMYDEVRKHGVPTLFSIGDELTNKGMEGVGIAGRLAKFVWEELPEIATTSDMNGYLEVMAMAPYLNVATFNNGWDGADHHNKDRHLLNRAFIEEVQSKTGAIPWFVNAGSGRLPFGFFFWKMSHYGVKGKVEWYYNLGNERGSLVQTQGQTIRPTLDYERCREGIDDLKYLCRLESLVAQANPDLPQVKNARDSARDHCGRHRRRLDAVRGQRRPAVPRRWLCQAGPGEGEFPRPVERDPPGGGERHFGHPDGQEVNDVHCEQGLTNGSRFCVAAVPGARALQHGLHLADLLGRRPGGTALRLGLGRDRRRETVLRALLRNLPQIAEQWGRNPIARLLHRIRRPR